jgi:PAS domain S-box-containing protein
VKLAPPRKPSAWPFVAVALLIPIVLAVTLLWIQAEYSRWETLRVGAQQSYSRRSQLVDLLSTMRAAETSERGYALGGDDQSRARYVAAEGAVRRELRNLFRAYRQEPSPPQIGELSRIADAKFAEMDEVIHLYDRLGAAATRSRINEGDGQRLMAQFEQLVGHIFRREIQVGDQRVKAFRARAAWIEWMMWVIAAIASVALTIILTQLWRQRRAKYKAALAAYEAAERNQTILNATADPIVIINPSGTIETINAAVTRVLGYTPEAAERRDIAMLSDIAPGADNFMKRIRLADGSLRTSFLPEQPIRTQFGETILFDVALGVMRLPDGDHIVASLRDTTERQRLDRLKDDLISTISHELRTPLTSVIGALSLLRADAAGALPEEAQELVQIAESNGQRLIRLINDMLDIDRIEAGNFRLATAPLDLRDVVRRACNDHAVLATSYAVTLDCQLPDEPLMVEGDEARLLQVLANLLSNAVKFSPEGGKVTVCARHDARALLVEVADEGHGIAEEFRSRIFGRFERAPRSEGWSGTGLGLAIDRDIVTRHGGDIWFEDRPTGGTRFVFSLPAIDAADAAGAAANRGLVLICEGDVRLGEELQKLVEAEGLTSRVVTSAAAARDALADGGYDLLILDMALDDPLALSLARDVRRAVAPGALSIILVSPDGKGDATARFSLDLVDWMDKPVDPARLKAALAAAMPANRTGMPIVLHLDDDQDTLDVTARTLSGTARILKARSLADARAILRSQTPDLVILDYHLASGTGLDLLPDLTTTRGVAIPAIVYSAHDVLLDPEALIDAVVVKSRHSAADLKATIRRVLSVRHERAA